MTKALTVCIASLVTFVSILIHLSSPPGSEVGPRTTATWGKAVTDEANAMDFKWEWNGRSSKYIPFDWSGP
jgi:hypothetical protein